MASRQGGLFLRSHACRVACECDDDVAVWPLMCRCSAIAVIQSLGRAGQQCAGDRSLALLSLAKGSNTHEVSHATAMFLGARVVYLPAYLSGIPMLRSLAYRLEVLQTSQELNQTGV